MTPPNVVASNLIRYETAEHVLCDANTPGAIPFVVGGRQPDGTYLYMFDLDSHTPDQNAARLLAYGHQCAPTVLAKLTPVPTKRNGCHLPFRYHRALNPGNIYDPRTNTHAGELLQERIDLVDAPLLSTAELCNLMGAFRVPGIFSQDDDQAPAELRGLSTTTRKEYLRIGQSYIAGWECISNPLARLDKFCLERPMVATYRAKLRTRADRSAAYGAFVQSLMLNAAGLGRTTEERCQMVAAMAIAVGAGGKEDERTYNIERDTPVLIAKILDGAPMAPRADGTIPRWVIPKWYSGEPIAPAPAPAAPAPRPAHRPIGDRAKMVKRLEKLIRRWLDDNPDGRIFYYVADIADDLGCSPRSAQNYLRDLELANKIKRGQRGGAGGRAYLDVLPAFWGANKSAPTPKTEAQTPAFWGASAPAESPVPMPESADQNAPTIEVERAPKACAPAPAAPGPIDDAAIVAAIGAYYAAVFAEPRPRRAHADQAGFMGRGQEVKAVLRRRRPGPLPAPAAYVPPNRVEEVDLPDFGAPPRAAGAHSFGAPLPAPAGASASDPPDVPGLIARLKRDQASRSAARAAAGGD